MEDALRLHPSLSTSKQSAGSFLPFFLHSSLSPTTLHRRFCSSQLTASFIAFFSWPPAATPSREPLLQRSSCSSRQAGQQQQQQQHQSEDAARQDGLGGDEPGAVLAAALPAAHAPRLLRAEPLQGLARRREDGHLRPLHAGAQPHGLAAPLALLRRQGLLVQPLLGPPQAQGGPQVVVGGGAQGRAAGQGVAGDRGHRGGGAPRRRGAHQDRAQEVLLLPRLRARIRGALLLLRARALGGKQIPEAADRNEEHQVRQLHHPGRHRRVAGAHRHGHHQRHRQVHLPQQGHLLRHPRHGRPIPARIQPAHASQRRPPQVLPGSQQPPHRQRRRAGQQGAALRRGPDADGGAGGRREEGGEQQQQQRGAGAHGAPDDAALAGLRAGRAGEAQVHPGRGVQGGDEPQQAQQAHLPREGLPLLLNYLSSFFLFLPSG